VSLANGTTADLKGNEAWLFAFVPTSMDPRGRTGMAAAAPGELFSQAPEEH